MSIGFGPEGQGLGGCVRFFVAKPTPRQIRKTKRDARKLWEKRHERTRA